MTKEELISRIVDDMSIAGNTSLEYDSGYKRVLEQRMGLTFTPRTIAVVYNGDDYLGSSYEGDWMDNIYSVLEEMDEVDLLHLARGIQKEIYPKVDDELMGEEDE
ncbi:MAG: hypothetical protein J6J36_00710 [Clostridia bacterium]|nr:hypothetical protein [Clostridia bacterium]